MEAIGPIKRSRGRPRKRPDKLHADKAYDFRRCRQALHARHVKVRIARRGVDSGQRLGRHRWVVERTLAWLARFRRLARDYERLPATLAGLHFVASACLMLRNLMAGLSLRP